jgi:hypothetical protein
MELVDRYLQAVSFWLPEDSINGALAVILVFAVVTHGLRATQDLRRLRGVEPLHHWAIRTLAGS